MKKILAITLLATGMAACSNAQGTFVMDSLANAGNPSPTSTSGGLVFIQGVLDTTTDVSLALLWGTSSSSVTTVYNLDPGAANVPANTSWLLGQSTGGGDITSYANGAIFDPNGLTYHFPTVAAGSQVWMILEAWTGTATDFASVVPNAGNGVYAGATGPFAVTLSLSSAPVQADISPMGSLNLVAVPDPTSLALAGLGGFGMLMALRRKQA